MLLTRLPDEAVDQARFRSRQARDEWNGFDRLLESKEQLSEKDDILPFFKISLNISLLIGSYFPNIRKCDVLAHEYPIYGDFRADLIVGDSDRREYLLVEFENGAKDSLFRRIGTKANRGCIFTARGLDMETRGYAPHDGF